LERFVRGDSKWEDCSLKKALFTIIALIFVSSFFLTGCTPEYEVSLGVKPTEAGSVYGTGTYERGKEVRINAEPKKGYVFEKWTRNDEKVSLDKTYTFKIEEDEELVAHFRKLIPDENLEVAIRDHIKKPEGGITKEDMQKITFLEAINKGITDIRGLEYAVNLERLNLQENEINNLEVLEKLEKLKELSLCLDSIEPTTQIDLITSLDNLKELEIKGLDRFCGVADLQLQGYTEIFFKDETYVKDILGTPEEVKLETEGYVRDPVGIFDLQVIRYAELQLNFVKELLPPHFEERADDFRFKEVEVFEASIKGPRGVEVGNSLEDVLNKFPVLYQDKENYRQYGRIALENGKVIKIEFSDYVAESPYELFPHHFNFTVYFLDNKVERYHLKHIMYDL